MGEFCRKNKNNQVGPLKRKKKATVRRGEESVVTGEEGREKP